MQRLSVPHEAPLAVFAAMQPCVAARGVSQGLAGGLGSAHGAVRGRAQAGAARAVAARAEQVGSIRRVHGIAQLAQAAFAQRWGVFGPN